MEYQFGDRVIFKSSHIRSIDKLDGQKGKIVGLFSEIGLCGPLYIVQFSFLPIELVCGFRATTFVLDEKSLIRELE